MQQEIFQLHQIITMTVDTIAQAQPTITATTSLTNSATPTIEGIAEPGSTLTLFVDGETTGVTTIADGTTGAYTIAPTAGLSDGNHTVTVTATDAAGNISTASSELNLTVDTTAPAQPAITTRTTLFDFNKDKTTLETDIVLTFSEAVKLKANIDQSTDTHIIQIIDADNGEIFETINSEQITGLGSNQITIDTLKDLEPSTSYQLLVDGIVDRSNNPLEPPNIVRYDQNFKKVSEIDGEFAFDRAGQSVSLSADGSVVAIGAPYHDGDNRLSSDNRGPGRIFEYDSGKWQQREMILMDLLLGLQVFYLMMSLVLL